MTIYEQTVKEDPQTGDLYIEFPEELMNQMGWDVGDELVWGIGSEEGWPVTIAKKENDDASPMDKT